MPRRKPLTRDEQVRLAVAKHHLDPAKVQPILDLLDRQRMERVKERDSRHKQSRQAVDALERKLHSVQAVRHALPEWFNEELPPELWEMVSKARNHCIAFLEKRPGAPRRDDGFEKLVAAGLALQLLVTKDPSDNPPRLNPRSERWHDLAAILHGSAKRREMERPCRTVDERIETLLARRTGRRTAEVIAEGRERAQNIQDLITRLSQAIQTAKRKPELSPDLPKLQEALQLAKEELHDVQDELAKFKRGR